MKMQDTAHMIVLNVNVGIAGGLDGWNGIFFGRSGQV